MLQQKGILHFNQINARIHMGQMRTLRATAKLVVLPYAVQYSSGRPSQVTNAQKGESASRRGESGLIANFRLAAATRARFCLMPGPLFVSFDALLHFCSKCGGIWIGADRRSERLREHLVMFKPFAKRLACPSRHIQEEHAKMI